MKAVFGVLGLFCVMYAFVCGMMNAWDREYDRAARRDAAYAAQGVNDEH
jgi:4-hydroxybenzoate polyprenyltransferase